MPIFSCIFLSNYWWQKSDIWSQASYRYPISWEAFFDPSDSYFLFAEERGYHKWALAHSSSCLIYCTISLNILFVTINNVFLGDGWMDSPGHSAQYCSYTFMELTTTNIFCIITMDKRQTDGKSTSLEKACFVKGLQYLLGKN